MKFQYSWLTATEELSMDPTKNKFNLAAKSLNCLSGDLLTHI